MMRTRTATLLALVGLVVALGAAVAVPDFSSVTEWEGVPLVYASNSEPRFAEVGVSKHEKCGDGECPFTNGVCCAEAGVCCEWGSCQPGKTTCSASREQNALVVAKAFIRNEADIEIVNEQGRKTKTEAGQKLVAEAAAKNTQEAAQKQVKDGAEDLAKNERAKSHEADLEKGLDQEEATKATESAQKSAAREALARKLTGSAAQYVLQGGRFDVGAKNKMADSITATTVYTFTFWVRQRTLVAGWRQLFQRGDSSDVRAPSAWIKDGTLFVEVEKNKGVAAKEKFTVGQWQHVAFRAASGLLEIFVDGKAAGDVKIANVPNNKGALWASMINPADAEISDLRVYGSKISDDAIKAVMAEKKHPEVKIGDGVIVLQDGSFSPTRGGRVESDRFSHNGMYSMGVFIRVLGKSSVATSILHKGANTNQRGPAVILLPKTGQVEINSEIGSGLKAKFGGKLTLQSDTWTHLAWTHKQGEFVIYVNGKEALRQGSATAPVSNSAPFFAGNTWEAAAPVTLANLAFANDIWTSADIKALMAKTFERDFLPKEVTLVKSATVNKATTLVAARVMNALQPSAARTYAGWVYLNSLNTGANTVIFSHGMHPAVYIAKGTNQLMGYSNVKERKSHYYLSSKERLRQGAWYHFAIVHYYGHFRLYINGSVDKGNKASSSYTPIDNNYNRAVTSVEGSNKAANAKLSDLRYWPVGLSDDDVWRVYKEAKHD